MKLKRKYPLNHAVGFSLIEMLVVIGIIGILASIILPALASAKTKAKMKLAQADASGLSGAIQTYYNDYSRFPSSANAATAAGAGDFTFGTSGLTATPAIVNGGTYEANNSEVIGILMAYTAATFPAGGSNTNSGGARNPRNTLYLNAKMSGGTTGGGVGTDFVFRDPWSNPYIISLDMNYDNVTFDPFYRLNAVSAGGINGLFQNAAMAAPNNWAARTPVMIWSFGPDGQADATKSANVSPNSDNIITWK